MKLIERTFELVLRWSSWSNRKEHYDLCIRHVCELWAIPWKTDKITLSLHTNPGPNRVRVFVTRCKFNLPNNPHFGLRVCEDELADMGYSGDHADDYAYLTPAWSPLGKLLEKLYPSAELYLECRY